MNSTASRAFYTLAILTIAIFAQTFLAVQPITAQSGCKGLPINNGNTLAWPTTKEINVVIFGTPNSQDFTAIDTGIQAWNGLSGPSCGNVSFKTAVPADHTYVDGENIPAYTIFVIRPPDGIVPVYRSLGLN